MKIAKFVLISLASITLFAASVEAKFNFGAAARVGRDADKPLTSELTYSDFRSGKYKLSLKAGWLKGSDGISFVTELYDDVEYINIRITERLYNELSQRKDFSEYLFYNAEYKTRVLKIPAHNLDGIKIAEKLLTNYARETGSNNAWVNRIPMDVISGECKGELVELKAYRKGTLTYCLADDLDDIVVKRSWF